MGDRVVWKTSSLGFDLQRIEVNVDLKDVAPMLVDDDGGGNLN